MQFVTSHARRTLGVLIAAILVAGMLAGCGFPDTETTSASSTHRDGLPVSVDNCGQQVTVTAPPTTVVGNYQQSVELLLSLGLGDSIEATVYPDNPPLPEFAQGYRSIPELSSKNASFEQVLSVDPDLVYGGYSSAFDDAAGRSRKAFADAGSTTDLNLNAVRQSRSRWTTSTPRSATLAQQFHPDRFR